MVTITVTDDGELPRVVARWGRDAISTRQRFTPAELTAHGMLGSLPDDQLARVEHEYKEAA